MVLGAAGAGVFVSPAWSPSSCRYRPGFGGNRRFRINLWLARYWGVDGRDVESVWHDNLWLLVRNVLDKNKE